MHDVRAQKGMTMKPRETIVFDPAEHSAMDRQFMLSQLVVPRPIAMVSTRSPDGVCNIAPMSYYLPITGSPMLVGVTMGLREDGSQKKRQLYVGTHGHLHGRLEALYAWSAAMSKRFRTDASFAIGLNSGTRYDIRLEYYECCGAPAYTILYWSTASPPAWTCWLSG